MAPKAPGWFCGRAPSLPRLTLALAAALVGLWIGKLTLAAAMLHQDPLQASRLDPGNASAIAAAARQSMEAGKVAQARRDAIAALRRDPTAVAAVQTLGITARDPATARGWLDYAERLSRRELQTNLWAIEYYVARSDTAAVLRRYDLALRTSVSARDTLFPILGQAIADPTVARALVTRLAAAPFWKDAFLDFVAADERTAPLQAARFLATVRQHGMAIPPAGLSALVFRALNAGRPDIAWYAYSLKRPSADRRRSRNPNFAEQLDNPAMFDWTMADDGGILARIVREGTGSFLEVEASPGAGGLAAQQFQMLPPGAYQLRVAGQSGPAKAVTWTLTCEDGTDLARVAGQGSARATVPPGCRRQSLKLDVYAGDLPDGVHARFAHASIVPAA